VGSQGPALIARARALANLAHLRLELLELLGEPSELVGEVGVLRPVAPVLARVTALEARQHVLSDDGSGRGNGAIERGQERQTRGGAMC
jgi:hypothetical protein